MLCNAGRFCIVTILFIVLFSASCSAEDKVPKFDFMWRAGIIVGLIVDKSTTDSQLKALIHEFQKVRKEKTLSKYIRPTTPGNPRDPYSQLIILVFSDHQWATLKDYEKYAKARDKRTAQTYLDHIRASYEYNFLDGKEYGSIGYDEGGMKSRKFKKIF